MERAAVVADVSESFSRQERCSSTTARRSAVRACAASEQLRANRKRPGAHKGKVVAGRQAGSRATDSSVRAKAGKAAGLLQPSRRHASGFVGVSLHARTMQHESSEGLPCHGACALLLMLM